jgi:3-hydroxyisobutyrate dehydrogenase-like beta-hydroxyacid dehydrogenase
MKTIGFIGLGHMAARYHAAGYTVYGEDRDREDARWLTDQGCAGSTPRAR